eukprot:jgi/Bigna1/126369/aug1.2_g1077
MGKRRNVLELLQTPRSAFSSSASSSSDSDVRTPFQKKNDKEKMNRTEQKSKLRSGFQALRHFSEDDYFTINSSTSLKAFSNHGSARKPSRAKPSRAGHSFARPPLRSLQSTPHGNRPMLSISEQIRSEKLRRSQSKRVSLLSSEKCGFSAPSRSKKRPLSEILRSPAYGLPLGPEEEEILEDFEDVSQKTIRNHAEIKTVQPPPLQSRDNNQDDGIIRVLFSPGTPQPKAPVRDRKFHSETPSSKLSGATSSDFSSANGDESKQGSPFRTPLVAPNPISRTPMTSKSGSHWLNSMRKTPRNRVQRPAIDTNTVTKSAELARRRKRGVKTKIGLAGKLQNLIRDVEAEANIRSHTQNASVINPLRNVRPEALHPYIIVSVANVRAYSGIFASECMVHEVFQGLLEGSNGQDDIPNDSWRSERLDIFFTHEVAEKLVLRKGASVLIEWPWETRKNPRTGRREVWNTFFCSKSKRAQHTLESMKRKCTNNCPITEEDFSLPLLPRSCSQPSSVSISQNKVGDCPTLIDSMNMVYASLMFSSNGLLAFH